WNSTFTSIHRVNEADPGNLNISVPGGRESNCDFPSSGERNGISPNQKACFLGLLDTSLGVTKKCFRRIDLERSAIGGNSPVVEKAFPPKWILHNAENEKFRRNLSGTSPTV